MFNNPAVAIFENKKIKYSEIPPYNPESDYPEYPFKNQKKLNKDNLVYEAVRECFHLMELDSENYNISGWNPLSSIISTTNTVVIKPNAVQDYNHNRSETVFASITHGSVLRAIIDYVYIALHGKGRIILADAPMSNSNWENWKKITGINEIVILYKKYLQFDIEVYDLRNLVHENWNGYAASNKKKYARRDPSGYVKYDLKKESEFNDFTSDDIALLYGSEYNRNITIRNHLNDCHKYLIAKTILDADVLVSVPKLKVHQKVGVTLNLKGMVGAMGDKNYIPHYRIGKYPGDEYPDQGVIQNFLNSFRQWKYITVAAKDNKAGDILFNLFDPIHIFLQKAWKNYNIRIIGNKGYYNITGGAWYGNDTAWRMTLDLNRLIYYLDKNGTLLDKPQRKFLSLIDGVIGGERIGPLSPTAKYCGTIICGFNPLSTDIVASRLMGFDPMKIKTLKVGLQKNWLKTWECSLANIPVLSNIPEYVTMLNDKSSSFLGLEPDRGWVNQIEIQPNE